MSDPYTSLVIPSTMSRPTEANSVEADLREARCAVKEMQEEEESEGMNEPSM